MKINILVWASFFLGGNIWMLGCGPRKSPVGPEKQEPSVTADNSTTPSANADSALGSTSSSPSSTDTQSNVQISDEILKACGIPAPQAFFSFDSAKLQQSEVSSLDKVATCFSSGPLKGRVLKLVGHADPRGSADYNTVLGQSRADSVAKYLNAKGLSKTQMSSTSRGASEAKGTDEQSWARDRRVELILGPALAQ